MEADGCCESAVLCSVFVCEMLADRRQQIPKKTMSPSSSSHLPLLHGFPALRLFPPTLCVQARRELRRLKEEARRKHAVAVIWAYWQGLQVPGLRGPVDLPPTHPPTYLPAHPPAHSLPSLVCFFPSNTLQQEASLPLFSSPIAAV